MSNPYDAAPPQEPHPQDPYDKTFSTHARRFFAWIRGSRISRGEDRWVGGVCAGLAERIGWSPVLVRALMAASTVVFGFGLAFYALAWFLLPDDYDGRILAQDLVNGSWRWVMLGPLAMFVAVFAFPGIGLFVDALALAALLVVINNLSHREIIAGRGSGYAGPQPNPPGPQPWSGGAKDGPAPRQTGPAGPSDSGSEHARWNGQAGPAGPAGPPEQPAYAMPARPSEGWAPDFGSADSAAAAAYRRPVQQAAPRYARRKPAGFGVVVAVLGLIFVSAAVLFGTQVNARLYLSDIVKLAMLWSAGACLLIGAVIVVLGLMGRRSGGLMPLAWLAGFVAVCVAAAGAAYTYNLNDMRHADALYTSVSGRKPQALGSGERDMATLKNGVAFVGDNYDNSSAAINLSDYAKGRKPHDLKLASGKTASSQCPAGEISLTAYRTQVSITLPDGCSYGFGMSYGSGNGGWEYYGSVRSIGGRYVSMRRSANVIGVDYMYLKDIGDIGDKNYSWLYGDDDQRPAEGPELWINATHVIEAKVSVRYASEPVTDITGAAWDGIAGTAWRGSSSRPAALTLVAANDGKDARRYATRLSMIDAAQFASTKEIGHE